MSLHDNQITRHENIACVIPGPRQSFSRRDRQNSHLDCRCVPIQIVALQGGNKAAKLKAIREALRTSRRVWLATDCDREGQLIGQEILREHYKYHGQVMRVLFTAQDSQTIRAAFGRAKPNTEYARLYAAAVARRQADQIYNLSLTRTATVIPRILGIEAVGLVEEAPGNEFQKGDIVATAMGGMGRQFRRAGIAASYGGKRTGSASRSSK